MDNQLKNELFIGITGHRYLKDPEKIQHSVEKVLREILVEYPEKALSFVSPLAEGADQIAAKAALDLKQFKLIVPLPLPENQYVSGLKTEKEQQNHIYLRKLANLVFELPAGEPGSDPYHNLAQYLACRCDILITVWNGEKALEKGGTGDVVELAKKSNNIKKIYWIYAENNKPQASNSLSGSKQEGEIEILYSKVYLG